MTCPHCPPKKRRNSKPSKYDPARLKVGESMTVPAGGGRPQAERIILQAWRARRDLKREIVAVHNAKAKTVLVMRIDLRRAAV